MVATFEMFSTDTDSATGEQPEVLFSVPAVVTVEIDPILTASIDEETGGV